MITEEFYLDPYRESYDHRRGKIYFKIEGDNDLVLENREAIMEALKSIGEIE